MTFDLSNHTALRLESLIEKNKKYVEAFQENPLMQFITSPQMSNKLYRACLLDCIQVFSDYFQKVVMLRYVLCDNNHYLKVCTEHLTEEFGHNLSLSQDRHHQSTPWDPILEATASWFSWKMFTLDNDQKTVLIHLVLESSANVFFQKAHAIMHQYKETDYFKIHSEADEKHEKMGLDLIEADAKNMKKLYLIQTQGWAMLNAVCQQIAHVARASACMSS